MLTFTLAALPLLMLPGEISPGRDGWSLGCQPFEFGGAHVPLDASQSCPGSGPRCVHGQAGPERGEMGARCPHRLQKGDPWGGGGNNRKPPQGPELTGTWHGVLRLERGPRGAGRAMALVLRSAFPPGHWICQRLTASACGWCSRAAGKCSWPPWAPAAVSRAPCSPTWSCPLPCGSETHLQVSA